ncbi:hypothetical protein [Nonomuraea sp. GTA35]|uniref:hypothetical protein n=1 Tax=Nonomuraea sp. GTA35 TaxID=1676746 RepID=UPI0035C22478
MASHLRATAAALAVTAMTAVLLGTAGPAQAATGQVVYGDPFCLAPGLTIHPGYGAHVMPGSGSFSA